MEQLPNGTLVAVGARLDPRAIDASYRTMQGRLKASGGLDLLGGLQKELASMGFRLPQDLDAVLGTKFDVAFGGIGSDGTPLVGIRSNADAAKAKRVLDLVSTQLGRTGTPFALHTKAAGGRGYAVALDSAYAGQLAAGGHLGTRSSFTSAVPDAAGATSVLYVDVAGLLANAGMRALISTNAGANLKALSAVGMSATTSADGSASFRLKIVTR